MTEDSITYPVSTDKPISDPASDELGYSAFAQHLARSICHMMPPEGLVIAIYGAWGMGKTSVLNLIEHYIDQESADNIPIIVRFNPWWFSGQEDLTRYFFEQLAYTLDKRQARAGKARDQLADVIELIGELPGATSVGWLAKLLRRKSRNVVEIKEQISKALRVANKRILIVIDDIDRLSVDEIGQLFSLVKGVADFPNVLYLLAFDKKVVMSALGRQQEISGSAYLEKIVQAPFDLPLPSETLLSQLYFKRLKALLAEAPQKLFSEEDLVDLYQSGMKFCMTTPRNVTRFFNTINVTYPAVRDEVNAVDFVGIEFLRVFYPTIYDVVRKHPEHFVGTFEGGYGYGSSLDNETEFHRSWLQLFSDDEAKHIKHVLARLFPRLRVLWRETSFANWASTRQIERRVCNPDICDVYFTLSVPKEVFSRTEFLSTLDQINDPALFSRTLLDLASQDAGQKGNRAKLFLIYAEDYLSDESNLDIITSILDVFFDIGDELVKCDNDEFFNTYIWMHRILLKVLQNLQASTRLETLTNLMQEGNATFVIVATVDYFGKQHGKYGGASDLDDERIFSLEQVNELEKIAIEKIENLAEQNTLLSVPEPRFVLRFWRDNVGDESVANWVRSYVAEDRNLVFFLGVFLQKIYSFSGYIPDIQYRLDPELIKPYIDPSAVVDRVQTLQSTP
ncbi:MAG: P-loop NTPase fold protein, partial [Bacillota bacterium]